MSDEIRVNGKPVPWSQGMTVRDVLTECNFVFPMLVVNIDGQLIKKDRYDLTDVPQGADVKVVHLVSGG